ncbi:hypothetical protein A1D22_07395 [Pasteurellaceae bacterium LFhippo2]|nr:hypothetical protein [Pasteurellaceae bacterium LFhippo2]
MINTENVCILKQTAIFKDWVKSLKNPIAKSAIAARIKRAEKGNFGDHKNIGNGIWEMRITVGAGYRIYYAQQGVVIYLLINGGDKSTQQKDIEKAKLLWAALQQGDQNE